MCPAVKWPPFGKLQRKLKGKQLRSSSDAGTEHSPRDWKSGCPGAGGTLSSSAWSLPLKCVQLGLRISNTAASHFSTASHSSATKLRNFCLMVSHLRWFLAFT